jgi:hypothetical protein
VHIGLRKAEILIQYPTKMPKWLASSAIDGRILNSWAAGLTILHVLSDNAVELFELRIIYAPGKADSRALDWYVQDQRKRCGLASHLISPTHFSPQISASENRMHSLAGEIPQPSILSPSDYKWSGADASEKLQ